MNPVQVPLTLRLDTLTCHHHHEGWKGAQSYLWVIFFKAAGDCLTITDQFRLKGGAAFHFSKGSHGNLGTATFSVGSTRQIPPEVGAWETSFPPLKVPHFEADITGVAGCLAILMEENNLTEKGAEAAHQFLNSYVETAVNKALAEFDPKKIDIYDIIESIKAYFTHQLSNLTNGVEEKLGTVVKQAQNLVQNLWTLVDKDRLIGYELWTFSHESLMAAPDGREYFSVKWRGEKGDDWELKGFAEVQLPKEVSK